ncbi:MAG: GNAT family N-acetyltransferase [Verrucomicrobiota bacterium]
MNNQRRTYDFESRQRFCAAVSKRGKLQFRAYVPGDETGIHSLCQHVFGSTSSPEEWRWRNVQNPAGKTIIIVAQEESGRIIGHLAGVATDLKVSNSFRKAFFLVDSAVDPSRQGRGVHAALTFEMSRITCDQESGFGFGLPNEHAYLPTLNLGAQRVLTVPLFIKVLDWQKVIHSRVGSDFLARIAGGFAQLFQRSKPTQKPNGLHVSEVYRFEKEADTLWRRIASRFPVCPLRNATVLNWRYFERPNSPYRVFSVSKKDEWQGYVVIRTLEKWGLRLGTVIDLFFDPDSAEAGMLLIGTAETELRKQGAVALWGLFSVPESYRKLFRRAGFFKTLRKRSDRPFHLLVDFVSLEYMRPELSRRDSPLLIQGGKWFLSLGDTDIA